MSSSEIPAPGKSARYSADEVIVYGIQLGRKGVLAVAVTAGGSGYKEATKVDFTTAEGSGAKAFVKVDETTGSITEVVVTNPGSYAVNRPSVSFVGAGTGATATAALGTMAVVNLEEGGRGALGITPLFNPRMASLLEKRGASFVILAAYGYAYEGHCYRFDKPRLLGAALSDSDEISGPIGCGFDPPSTGGTEWYRAWRLKSNDRIIELGTTVGRVEELILDANRPGRRPPNTYASEMQLAHRGGRLTSP